VTVYLNPCLGHSLDHGAHTDSGPFILHNKKRS